MMTTQQAFDAATRLHQSGQFAEAESLCRQILAQQPDDVDALHLLGVIAHREGRRDVALDLIGRAIALRADFSDAYNSLGIVLKGTGRLDDAIAAYRKAISLQPAHPQAYNNLGNALSAQRQLDDAIAAYRKAVALKPDYSDALGNLERALHSKGQLDEAIAVGRQVIALRPNAPEACTDLGNALSDAGRIDEAVAAYRQAIAVRPDYFQAHSNLGSLFVERGQLDEAIAAYRRAVAIRPDAEIHYNLGNALAKRGQLDEAVAAYRQALALRPDYPQALSNLGNTLTSQGQLDDAVAVFRRAIALDPASPEAHSNLGVALKDMGELDEAIATYRRAIELKSDFAAAHSNLLFTMHYHPNLDARTIAEEHRRWNREHAEPLKRLLRPHPNDRDPDRRLRIGYVSPDLRDHPVGRFLLPLLAHHYRERFEIFAYAQVILPDSMSQRLRSHSDRWQSIVGLSDEQAADLIRADQIDILVDLAMHAADNRMLVFARKPAPVQVTWLAYCSTTGLETMDYRLSDPWMDPIKRSTAVPAVATGGTPVLREDPFCCTQGQGRYGETSIYSERTIRLPESYWCYQPHAASPEVGPLPATTRGTVTFGSLNNFCKVSEPALAAWGEILRAVPGAELLLHAYEGRHRQRVKERMEQDGIDPGRVRFVGKLPTSEYFASYRSIDIALDTFPYAGGTTTCDALWMGVPVVSLAGETAVSRAGVSILSNVGLPELVAQTFDEYLRIAVDLARDPPRMSELRSTLRRRMEPSPLMDAPRFARNIEAAYRQMWRTWCGTYGMT